MSQRLIATETYEHDVGMSQGHVPVLPLLNSPPVWSYFNVIKFESENRDPLGFSGTGASLSLQVA